MPVRERSRAAGAVGSAVEGRGAAGPDPSFCRTLGAVGIPLGEDEMALVLDGEPAVADGSLD